MTCISTLYLSVSLDTQIVSSEISVTIIVMGTKAQHDKRYKAVPEFLKQLREEAGLTQRQIGKLLQRPQSWVYGCETANRRVDIAEFCDWCKACNTDPAVAIRRLERKV